MPKTAKDILILILFTLVSTFLIWLPHILSLPDFFGLKFSNGFNTIYRNFDGLEYVIISKTFYFKEPLTKLPQSLGFEYYPSHFPLYSILILVFAPFLGYLKSMLFVSVLSATLSVIIFYKLVRDFKLTENPLILSLIFLILPARWVIVRSVGSSEPTFILFVLLTFYFLLKYESGIYKILHLKNPPKNYRFLVFSALSGLAAQLTRPPGTLLLGSLAFYILWKHLINNKFKNFWQNFIAALKYFPYVLIPAGLVAIFLWFQIALNDFWAYFHSGDNIHLFFPPFQVFNKSQFWVGDIWLEDIIYIFIFGFLGGIYLWKKKLYSLAIFVFTYFVASTLVAHRDISRYTLPAFPFILIAFEKLLISKEFRIVLIIISLAIYLYAQNFILANTAPYPNVELFNN